MKVVYIAGAYRDGTEWGLEQNIRHAEAVAIKLWQKGFAVICPHKNTSHFGGLCSDDTWLRGDLEILSRCDIVMMLKGYEKSKGAVAELKYAKELGKLIHYEAILNDH